MSRADAIKDGEGGSAGTARCEVPAGQLVGQLGGKSLFGQVMALALWPFLQNLMGVGVGFTDMIIAGRIQVEDTKAIFDMMGASMYLVWLLMILQMGMGVTGLALGTVMGWAAGAVLILWFLRPVQSCGVRPVMKFRSSCGWATCAMMLPCCVGFGRRALWPVSIWGRGTLRWPGRPCASAG